VHRDTTEIGERLVSEIDRTREHLIETYRKKAKHYDITSRFYPVPGYPERAQRLRAVQALGLRRGDSVVDVACGTGLNFALIPPFGIVGAALATAAGYGALAASFYWASQRAYRTPYQPRKVLGMLAAAVALGTVGLIPFGSLALALSVKLVALAAFVGFTWLSGTMGRSEFKELRRFAGGMIAVPFARAG